VTHATTPTKRSGQPARRPAIFLAHRITFYDFFLGTFAPFFRASDNPIAIACARLVTRPPFPTLPDRSVPFFSSRIARSTLFPAAFPYFAIGFLLVRLLDCSRLSRKIPRPSDPSRVYRPQSSPVDTANSVIPPCVAGTCIAQTFGETLGNQEGVWLVKQTLEEEKGTNDKLTKLADTITLWAAFTRNFGVECFTNDLVRSRPANSLVAIIVQALG
jgi:hypothetical protein